jgi:DNA polymerase elongation subunit (family B)
MNDFYSHISVRGEKILYRGYTFINGNWKRTKREVRFQPTFFVPSQEETEYLTLDGKYVEPFSPGSINECREFIDQYKDVQNFKIYGNDNYSAQFIGQNFASEIEYDPSILKVAYLDIETRCDDGFPSINDADQEVNVITIRTIRDNQEHFYTFGLGKFHSLHKNHTCMEYDNEAEMLSAFIEFWRDQDFDIVTGWNIQFFDIPYLIHRIDRLLGEGESKRLSPWFSVKSRIVRIMNKDNICYDLVGISTLDYFDLYRKFTFVTRESYKLDHIAFVELQERKETFEGFDGIQDLYTRDFQKFIQYNVKDVSLVVKLEEKLKLLELGIALAYSAKVNFNDVFSQVKTWDSIIYHHLNAKNIVIPMKESKEKEDKFEGAFVKEPQVGMHNWIVSFDLDSLYPHLIMQYNISPETKTSLGKRGWITPDMVLSEDPSAFAILNEVKNNNQCIAANGITFRTDKQGFLPALMEKMYEERKLYKEKMLECKRKLKEEKDTLSMREKQQLEMDISKYYNFQLVRKIQLNSAFGGIGNEYFRFYDLELAEAITISGQLSIRWIEKQLNVFLNTVAKTSDVDYILAADTDSVYLCLNNIAKNIKGNKQEVVKRIDKACNDIINPFIEKKYQQLANIMNAYDQKMHMKRESISDKGIFTAKKRYMLNVYMGEDNVVLSDPDIKIMGIETARSSTPQIVREALKKAIYIILNEDEKTLIEFIESFQKEFNESSPEEIAFPRSCNSLKEYSDAANIYRKSTPIAVKGALLYNHYMSEKDLLKRYNSIKDGEKVKFVYLKLPNTINEHVISFPGTLPKELDLHTYVDYKVQFEKSFIEPLSAILNVIGWSHEEKSTLESLFS